MKPAAALALLLLPLSAGPSAGGEAQELPPTRCSAEARDRAAARLRETREELIRVKVDNMDTIVSPGAGRLIELAKDRVRMLAGAEMACAPATASAGEVARALPARLARADGFASFDAFGAATTPHDGHGRGLVWEAAEVPGHPSLLAVRADLSIQCGWDAMLILFERTAEGWRERMVRRSEPYREVRGAWGGFQWAVSPAGPGGWYLATARSTPWCTSAWQGLRYDLSRPGPSPERPRIFLAKKTVIYLGNDGQIEMKAGSRTFDIRHDGAISDPAIHNRRHVARFAIVGLSARRVPPVAENVRDFTDEWARAEWAEASAWSRPAPAVRAAHRRLKGGAEPAWSGFLSIRGCAGGFIQVGLEGREKNPAAWLRIGGGASGPWRVEDVRSEPWPECRGAELLERPS